MGLRRERREPRAFAALPLGAAAVRHGDGLGGRPGRRARPLRPGPGHGGDRAGATDVHVLRADAPAAAVRALGRGRYAGPVVVPARRARRCAVPGRGEAAAGRDVPRGVDLGVLRVDRGSVHRLPLRGVARAARYGRPGSAGPGAVHGCGRHDLVRGAVVRAVLVLRRPRQDGRRLAGDPGRSGVHRRRPRPARRRRLPVPRGPPRGPGDQRRRERLPARGRAGAPRAPGRRRRRRLRRPRRAVGTTRVRGVRRHGDAGRARGVRPRAARPTQTAQDLAPAARPAPHPHREGASATAAADALREAASTARARPGRGRGSGAGPRRRPGRSAGRWFGGCPRAARRPRPSATR